MNIFALEVFLIGGPISQEFAKKNPEVSRVIEIRGDQTLEDLHQAIFIAFERDDEHMYEFQLRGKGPNDPKAERYSVDPERNNTRSRKSKRSGDVSSVAMDDLKLKEGDTFGYWFDFGDDWWHQINVLSIADRAPDGDYPRETKRIGNSPPQYPDVDDEE